jgi:peptide/nickel transport system substrate-binding protein
MGLALVIAFAPRLARGAGRTEGGGSIALHLPWPLTSMDPHRTDDATAAILGGALFDTLYAQDETGAIAPALAESDPEPTRAGLRVAVRGGLRTARDRPLDARDALFSIGRARAMGARGWLSDVPTPKLDGCSALLFAMDDAAKLVRALASPLVAIVPSSFAPERPDGTGPFRAEHRDAAVALERNTRAALGPPFLDEILVRSSSDLAASLRAFESGEDAIGWLGSGLHEPRPGARPFDFGPAAWPILRTGHDAGNWDAPGIAQRIADGIAYARVAYLVLGPPWTAQAEEGWGGPPCDLLVRDDAPWLVELARAVAATARPLPAAELTQRRASRAFALMVDIARPLAPSALGAFVGLATADDPQTALEIARRPPRVIDPNPRALTRTARIGVLGEVRVQGARSADLSLGASPAGGLDLGNASRARGAP